jgi:hypothetical protein
MYSQKLHSFPWPFFPPSFRATSTQGFLNTFSLTLLENHSQVLQFSLIETQRTLEVRGGQEGEILDQKLKPFL